MKLFSRVAALVAVAAFVLVPTAAQADPGFYAGADLRDRDRT